MAQFVLHLTTWTNNSDQVILVQEEASLPEGQGKGDEDEAKVEESGVHPATSTDKPSVSVHNVEEPAEGSQYMFKKEAAASDLNMILEEIILKPSPSMCRSSIRREQSLLSGFSQRKLSSVL